MSTRTLDLSTYPLRYIPLIEWVTANGIEPRCVPVGQRVEVTEDSISLNLFVLDKHGRKQITHPGDYPREARVTVPLVSPLEAHGL
jgi:hypothetical protein